MTIPLWLVIIGAILSFVGIITIIYLVTIFIILMLSFG